MWSVRPSIGEVARRKARLRRVESPAPTRLSGSQREALELLHEYGFLTPRLLALVYGARAGREGRGYWHLQRELRRLFDAGLVRRFNSPTTAVRNGSAECVYAITHEGARMILDSEDYAQARHDIYNRESKQRGNFEHQLAIATLQLVLTLGQRGWTLVAFRAEERNPRACVRVKVKDCVLTVWPDAAAIVELCREAGEQPQRFRYLFEIDLSRKNNQRVEERFLAYATYLVEWNRRDHQRAQASPALETRVVVFVVTHERELERFLDCAGRVLSAWPAAERPCFLFWSMQDWYALPNGVSATVGRPLGAGAVLRPPAAILKEARLATVEGAARTLVEEEPVV